MGILARLTGATSGQDRLQKIKATSAQYRGVQVMTHPDGCCGAAADIAGRRYLAHEVPRFPLDGCDSDNCRCSYKLFNDRRTDLRRASDVAYDIASELRTADNRRGDPPGRRNGDRK